MIRRHELRRLAWPAPMLLIGTLSALLWGLLGLAVRVITS